MNIEEAIEHAKNKKGMYVSFGGVLRALRMRYHGYKYSSDELSKHYYMAKEAFMAGDLETVAEFFGLYV